MSKESKNHKQDTEVLKIKDDVQEKALEIITKIWPAKVVEITKLLEDESLNIKLSDVHQTLNIDAENNTVKENDRKRRKIDETSMEVESNGQAYSYAKVPSNTMVMKIFETLKANVLEFIQNVSRVKIWIQLNVPKIEDGNNFSVSVQEDTLGELSTSEDLAVQKLESISKYHTTRGKLISKCLKYPGVEDYRKSVIELDEREFNSARLSIREIRDCYAILYDLILKNFDRIRKPRSELSISLY